MLRCIAIDDEPIALSIISRFCARHGEIELETYTSPRLGMQRVNTWQPDILFLDIELNGTSGIELARHLPASCCLIFTTAYADYALEGFELEAVDFLHKPYFYERFDQAIQRAKKWLRMHDLLRLSESANRQIILKSEYKNVTVPVDTILYIESIDNYVRVHLSDGTSVLSKLPLRQIEALLPADSFIRIHRSFIIARNRIAHFTRSEVTLSPTGKILPIGKKYADEWMEKIGPSKKTE